jgi:translation initiation factor 4E
MWEDESNKLGGKISVRLSKTYSTLIWEEALIIVISEILPLDLKESITGVVISVKNNFDILQFWLNKFNKDIVSQIE